jgi:hypothetical protein
MRYKKSRFSRRGYNSRRRRRRAARLRSYGASRGGVRL